MSFLFWFGLKFYKLLSMLWFFFINAELKMSVLSNENTTNIPSLSIVYVTLEQLLAMLKLEPG